MAAAHPINITICCTVHNLFLGSGHYSEASENEYSWVELIAKPQLMDTHANLKFLIQDKVTVSQSVAEVVWARAVCGPIMSCTAAMTMWLHPLAAISLRMKPLPNMTRRGRLQCLISWTLLWHHDQSMTLPWLMQLQEQRCWTRTPPGPPPLLSLPPQLPES